MMTRIGLALVAMTVGLTAAMAGGDEDLNALLGELTFGETELVNTPLLMPSDPQADQLVPLPHEPAARPSAQSAASKPMPPLPVSEPESAKAPHGPLADTDAAQEFPWLEGDVETGLSDPPPVAGVIEPVPMRGGPAGYGATAPQHVLPEHVLPGAAIHQPWHHGGAHHGGAFGHAAPHGAVADCGTAGGCEEVAYVPHRPVNLPPPSSLLGYYQSDPCYSDVWAGYASERQRRCEHMHEHIHGRCDCFDPAKRRWGWGAAKCECDGEKAVR